MIGQGVGAFSTAWACIVASATSSHIGLTWH